MRNEKLKTMIYAAMYVALAIVLDYAKKMIPFASFWPNGGSVDISLIPLVFASFHLGWKWGLITSAMQFVVSIAMGATHIYIAPYNPSFGFLCDYIIPSVIIGASSFLFSRKDRQFNKISLFKMETGILATMAIRIFSMILSGAYCWMEEAVSAGSKAAWAFAISDTLGYGIPTLVILLIIVPVLYKTFKTQITR